MRSKILIYIGVALLAISLILAACGSNQTTTPTIAIPTKPPVISEPTATSVLPTPTVVQPTPTVAEVTTAFTATITTVGMYPAMGDINPANGRPTGILVPRGDDPTKTYAVFGPGTANVPPGVPVYLQAGAAGLAEGAKLADYAWKLDKAPTGSAAALAKLDKAVPGLSLDMVTFTPDKEGEYFVSLVVTDDKGTKSVAASAKIVAARYVGSEACKACHAAQYDGWSQTAHGNVFKNFVNQNAEAEYFNVGFGCARCHTVGYYPVKESTGGWWDTFVNVLKLDWNKDLKNTIALNAFNAEPGKDTFSTLDPKLQAVSNIGCESCHGPASAHVAVPGPDTAPRARADSSSCNQCHNASGHHTRGGAMANSAHSMNSQIGEGSNPSCARCHSPQGFIDTIAGAKTIRAINQDIGCPVCHDPHSATNPFQLRTVDKVTVPMSPASESFTVENAGLSAVCMNCHNARRAAKTVEDPAATRFTPHSSTATELITGRGGYDWGVKLQNSGHVNIGQEVLNDEHTNQPGNMDLTQLNYGSAPGPCVLCHMYSTPGGTWDTTDSMAVPGHQKIGGHSFNMITEVNGTEVQHTQPCRQCHPGITTFDFPASADYDGNGKIEGVQTEVDGLKALLKTAILAWKDEAGKSITLDDAGAFVTTDIKLTVDIKAALYNYAFVNESASIHNFARSVGLLQVSIAKLTGKDVPNATLLYTK